MALWDVLLFAVVANWMSDDDVVIMTVSSFRHSIMR